MAIHWKYPCSLPAAAPQIVFTIIPNVTEAGRYVVFFDGEGELTAAMTTKVVSLRLAASCCNWQAATRIRAASRLPSSDRPSSTTSGISRILAEADEGRSRGQSFSSGFSGLLQAVAFRCGSWPWMATNNSLAKEWRSRKLPGFYSMVGEGGDAIGRWGKPASEFQQLFAGELSLEIMIQLANRAKGNPWFCMPHRLHYRSI